MTKNCDNETKSLMEDVYNYLMQIETNTGLNIKNEFPNTTVHNGIIKLKDKNFRTQFTLRIEKTATNWDEYIEYLIDWAKTHQDDECCGMSPNCYEKDCCEMSPDCYDEFMEKTDKK